MLARFCLFFLAAVLTGCGSTPGMFVGASADRDRQWVFLGPKQSPQGTKAPSPLADGPTITFKIVPISAESIAASVPLKISHTLPTTSSIATTGYYIGAQDILRVDVWGHPDLGTAASGAIASGGGATAAMPASGRVVDESGNIFVPLVGVTRASGFTASQLREKLTQGLSKFLRDPQVEVSVVAYRSKRVLVSGEVRTPGMLPLTDVSMRLTDAIANVGGTSAEADLSQVALVRAGRKFTINLHRVLYEGDSTANVLLESGDSISVPDRSARKVFVLGELMQPKTQVLRYGRVTLAEVLSDAGGLNPLSSNGGEVFVIRADDQQDALVYQLDAREPAALVLAERFPIYPRDTIYINPTNLTRIGRVVSQLLPTLSAASAVRTLTGN